MGSLDTLTKILADIKSMNIREPEPKKKQKQKMDLKKEKLPSRINGKIILCLDSVIDGSPNKETPLTLKATGLLAICDQGKSHDLMRKTQQAFYRMNFQDVTVNLLECIAVTTLAGTSDSSEIAISMTMLWDFILSYSQLKSSTGKGTIAAAAISAWALLLATIDTQILEGKRWRGVLSTITSLLEKEECVRMASIGALAIICEEECFRAFCAKDEYYNSIQDWKTEIREQVIEACGWRPEFSKLFQVGCFSESSIVINGWELKPKSLSHLTKMKFIEAFLDEELTVSMMETNRFVQWIFGLQPNVSYGPQVDTPEFEEVEVKYSYPIVQKRDCRQRLLMSKNSTFSKAKSKLLTKQREIKGENWD